MTSPMPAAHTCTRPDVAPASRGQTAPVGRTGLRTAGPFWLARVLVLTGWAMGFVPAVHAAETSASAAAALKVLALPLGDAPGPASTPGQNSAGGPAAYSPAAQGQRITVQKGESIDAVIRRGLPGLPLKEDFMRLALAKANPKIFPRGQTYPVRPGTVLTLPSHEELRQLIVSRHPEAAALFQAAPAIHAVSDEPPGPDKRRWVRFP